MRSSPGGSHPLAGGALRRVTARIRRCGSARRGSCRSARRCPVRPRGRRASSLPDSSMRHASQRRWRSSAAPHRRARAPCRRARSARPAARRRSRCAGVRARPPRRRSRRRPRPASPRAAAVSATAASYVVVAVGQRALGRLGPLHDLEQLVLEGGLAAGERRDLVLELLQLARRQAAGLQPCDSSRVARARTVSTSFSSRCCSSSMSATAVWASTRSVSAFAAACARRRGRRARAGSGAGARAGPAPCRRPAGRAAGAGRRDRRSRAVRTPDSVGADGADGACRVQGSVTSRDTRTSTVVPRWSTSRAASWSSQGASVAQCAASTSAMRAGTALADRLDGRVVLEIGGHEGVGAWSPGGVGERGAGAAADRDGPHRPRGVACGAHTPGRGRKGAAATCVDELAQRHARTASSPTRPVPRRASRAPAASRSKAGSS